MRPPINAILLWGTVYGLGASVGYTSANIFLRRVVDCDPIWVSCVKSFPTVLLAAAWLGIERIRGRTVWPSAKTLVALLAAGLLGQLVGNVAFQWSLGIIGIALTVPLVMGAVMIWGALLGRVFLNEPVTWPSAVAMGMLLAAIGVLSFGAGDASRSVMPANAPANEPMLWRAVLAVFASNASGFAYAALGVVIRHGVSGRASVMATLFCVSSVGAVSLGVLSLMTIGWTEIAATRTTAWTDIGLAGLCNFVAFLALTKALQMTTVVYVNGVNASQVALAAVAGVALFGEEPSVAMSIGAAMTALGLGVLAFWPRERSLHRGVTQFPSASVPTDLRPPAEESL